MRLSVDRVIPPSDLVLFVKGIVITDIVVPRKRAFHKDLGVSNFPGCTQEEMSGSTFPHIFLLSSL
jgi:hypothetical protein